MGSQRGASKCSCTPVRAQCIDSVGNLVEGGIDEDADLFECWRQVGHNGGDLLLRYRRGLGAKTNPTASAPASAASCASSSEVLPQILIQRLILRLAAPGDQFGQRDAGIGLAHQAFADEEGIEAGRRSRTISSGVEIPLSVTRTTLEGMRSTSASEVSGLTSKVFRSRLFTPMASAPVSPRASRTRSSSSAEWTSTSTSSESRVRGCGKMLEFGAVKCGGDEQDGVGAVGACFDDLVLVDR